MEDKQKQVKNLFKKIMNNQNSVFYSSDKITRTLLNKGRKSSYEKDKGFYKIFNFIEDKDVIYHFDTDKPKLLFYTPFVEQKKDIDRSSSLYTINGPMQFFHADLANLQFFAKSTVDSKYDLFSSKIYVYTMRKKVTLCRKWNFSIRKLNKNVIKKRKLLQVDLEFQENEIKN